MGIQIINRSLRNFPKRYLVIFLVFLSDIFKAYLMGGPNLVIAELTTPKSTRHGNATETVLDWSSKEIGTALGAHATGHIFAAFISGSIVHKVGGVTLTAVGLLGAGIVTLLDPLTISAHVYMFTIARFLYGIFMGFSFVGAPDIVARWIPRHERVRALTATNIGYGLGTAITFPLTGLIISHLGWSRVFYIFGVMILVWCLIWIAFVSNDPSADRFISREERDYLSNEINYISKDKNCKIPYKDILTSVPMYALLNEFFICSFITSFSKMMPFVVKDLYAADVQLVGLISGIPDFASLIVQPIFACFADYMRSSGYSIGKLHKWILFWGQSMTVLFFLFSTVGSNEIGCVVCITLAKISFGLSQVSYSAIVIDTSGQYAGFVESLTVVTRSIASFLNPILMGILIQEHGPLLPTLTVVEFASQTRSEWNTYFLSISFLAMYGVIMFLIFGSGDLQPWATVSSPQEIISNEDVRSERRSQII